MYSFENSYLSYTACPVLDDIQNGHVNMSDGMNYRDIATYTCDDEYTLIGESTRQCGDKGTWIGTPPTCQLTG